MFFIIGYILLLRGFHFNNQFSLMDYILHDNIIIIEEIGENQIKIIHGHPLSYIMIESMVIYCILNVLGVIIGLNIDKRS